MQDLKITLVQANLLWEDIKGNLDAFEQKILAMDYETDLIILPEMFNTGFTMNAEANAEQSNGRSMKWMADMAGARGCVLCGSLIIAEEGRYYNRFIWMHPDGSFQQYDKKHLFRMGDEHHYFSPGNNKLIAELKGWKIFPLICYDLRFPVWSKNTFGKDGYGYDLLIYVANWPAIRSGSWTKLLQARAIENMAYATGLNRVGMDGKGFEYSGGSLVAAPDGTTLDHLPVNKEVLTTVALEYGLLEQLREKLGVGNDWDHFNLS